MSHDVMIERRHDDFTRPGPHAFLRAKNALNAATASVERMRSPNRWLSWSIRRVRSSGDGLNSLREIATASAGSAQISRATLRARGFGLAGRHHVVDETGDARILGVDRAAHHQRGEGALVSHGARHQQAGGAFRNQPQMDEGRGEGRRRGGDDVIAMEQHGGADADRDAVDRGDDRLGVMRQRIEKFDRIGFARRIRTWRCRPSGNPRGRCRR